MRNVAIMLLSAFFFSCEDPINIAVDTPSNGGQFSTSFTDTLTVTRSTVMIDSIATSEQTGVVVGHYKDPVFGEVSAAAFAEITLPFDGTTSTYYPFRVASADSMKAVYDSMYVYVVHNGFTYGDTTKPVTLNIHRLTEDFVKNKKYLNDETMGYNQTPLASKVLTHKDFKRATVSTIDSLIKFKIPDAVGQEIFAYANKEEGRSIDKFTAAVKGFAFTANQSAENVYGLSLTAGTTYPVVFYHIPGDTVASGLPLSFLGARFSNIKTNRQGKVLQDIKQFQSIPAELTGNKTYIQTGAGITTKVSFPTLANLLKVGSNNVAINKAELILEPDLDATTGNFFPPIQIALVEIGKDNRLKKTNNIEDFVALDVASGTQYVSDYSTTNNNYKFNFTSYIQELINNRKTTDGIAIVPSILSTNSTTGATSIGLYNNNVSRAVFKNIKLNVYYSGKK
ncbi:hypothetical protein GCM10027442_48760 [Emticicia fontis]